MLKLKLQSFGHLMQRADSLEKTLMLGKIEGRRRGRQMMRWLHGINDSMDMNVSKLWETVKDREDWRTIQLMELYSVLCGDLNGREIQKRGGICIADLLCCTVETNTTLQSNYTPIRERVGRFGRIALKHV